MILNVIMYCTYVCGFLEINTLSTVQNMATDQSSRAPLCQATQRLRSLIRFRWKQQEKHKQVVPSGRVTSCLNLHGKDFSGFKACDWGRSDSANHSVVMRGPACLCTGDVVALVYTQTKTRLWGDLTKCKKNNCLIRFKKVLKRALLVGDSGILIRCSADSSNKHILSVCLCSNLSVLCVFCQ